jgi:putative copper export protein
MRWLRVLGIYALLSGLLAGLMLLQAFPARPETPLGWILLFVLALPLALAGEWAGDKLLNNKLGRYVDDKAKEQRISIVRIIFALGVYLGAIAAVIALYRVWQNL